jgi:hypothetical protein
MKKLSILFTILVFGAGIAIISCTKEATTTPPTVSSATDAIVVDNTVSDITATIENYEAVNPSTFTDPTLKAMVAGPTTVILYPKRFDSCAIVTGSKTNVITGTAVTGATVTLKIDFGTIGCIGKDGITRKGTITSTYTWVKLGGWTRVSAIDLYVNDVHHVGTQTATFGLIGPNNHAFYTDTTSLTITATVSGVATTKIWTSDRQRELVEGNGGIAVVKIWKITGNSSFTNAAGDKSTYTIINPLYRTSNCKDFVAGSVQTVSTAGVTTTIDYGTYTTPAAVTCKDGFTVNVPAGPNGKGAFSRFIKFGI